MATAIRYITRIQDADDFATLDAVQFVTVAATGYLTNERALTGTANQITVTDGGAGAAVTLSTPQDIHTAANPTFNNLSLDGNLAVGGTAQDATRFINYNDGALSTTDSVTPIYANVAKIAGVTDAADYIIGAEIRATLNQAGGIVGGVYGGLFQGRLNNGTADLLYGLSVEAQHDGTTVTADMFGIYTELDIDTGTIGASAYGHRTFVNQEAANTISGDAFVHYLDGDFDGTVTGTAYMLYLNEQTGVDFGIYQAGTAPNYLQGQLQLPTAGVGAGILIGGDAQWYRSAADTMRTPDDVVVDGNIGIGITSFSDLLHAASGTVSGEVIIDTYSATNTRRSSIFLRKSASNTKFTLVATADGESLADIEGAGVNTTPGFVSAGRIQIIQEGAAGVATVGGRIVFSTATSTAAVSERMRIDSAGNVGINVAPTAKLHVDQASTTAAIPVLYLDQADLSEEMIEFNTTIGVGNPIEAIGAKALTTTHFIRITVTGVGYLYVPAGTIA